MRSLISAWGFALVLLVGQVHGVLAGTVAASFVTGIDTPIGMATDASNNLYVATWGGNTIVKFAANAGVVTGGGGGSVLATLNSVTSVAVDSVGNLYAGNSNGKILKYPAVAGNPGTTPTGVDFFTGANAISHILIDPSDNLYAADSGNGSIYKIPAGSTPGMTAASKLYATITGGNPQQMALDTAGDLYVVDNGLNKVIKIAASNQVQTNLITGLNYPLGLVIDSANNLYLLDQGNSGKLFKYAASSGVVQGGSSTLEATLTAAPGNQGSPQGLLLVGPDKVLVSDASTVGNIAQVTVASWASAPGVPTIGTVTAGSGSISVAFTAPAVNGGSVITGYSVTCNSSDGGAGGSNTGASSPINVSGLTNGKTYTCSVTATNAIGTSDASGDSSSVIPKANQTISFTGPGDQNYGVSPTLSASSSSGLTVVFTSVTPGVCTVAGSTVSLLSTGTCTINANQAGSASYLPATQVQQSFVVNATVPGAPTNVSASGGDSSASVSFSAPTNSGGSVITGYGITCTSSNGGADGSNTGASSPINVSGLTNGKTYSCSVTATNVIGTGSASVASSSFILTAGPLVTSVSVPADGRYKAAATLDFTIHWDNAANIIGIPRLILTVGSTTRYATYQSGSGSTATVFRYTVQAGDTDSDGISVGNLELNSGSIRDSSNRNANLSLTLVGSTSNILIDTSAPMLPSTHMSVNNQVDPNKIVLTFNEDLDPASLGVASAWALTANAGTPTYSVASVTLSAGKQITLTLSTVDLAGSSSYITNAAANAHLKVTPPTTLTDLTGNAYMAGLVAESASTHVLDATAPVLSAVGSSAVTSSGTTLNATANEKARGYWIAISSGATAPTPTQVKAGNGYGVVTVVASGNGLLPATSAGALTVNGLAPSTGYDIYLIAEDAAGNVSTAVSMVSLTTTMPVVNGSCGAANHQPSVFAPASSRLCASGAASAVTTGSPWIWTCVGSGGGSTASCSAPNAPTTTGTGVGRMEITASSGAAAWDVQSANFVSVASTGASAPAGYSFPHGLLDVSLTAGTANSSATVTITYPTPLPAGTVYWQFGRRASAPVAQWYQMSADKAVIGPDRLSITLTLTDNTDGDDAYTIDSLIVDSGGPGAPLGASGATSIPTLSQWGQIILSALLVLFGVCLMRRYRGVRSC